MLQIFFFIIDLNESINQSSKSFLKQKKSSGLFSSFNWMKIRQDIIVDYSLCCTVAINTVAIVRKKKSCKKKNKELS